MSTIACETDAKATGVFTDWMEGNPREGNGMNLVSPYDIARVNTWESAADDGNIPWMDRVVNLNDYPYKGFSEIADWLVNHGY